MDAIRRRLLAGTASLACCSPYLRHARAADVDRFPLGIASGYPHPGGMVLWTRLVGADLPPRVAVQWEVAHDERFERIAARGSEDAEADWGHSVHADATGLEADRWYWYRFRALGRQSMAGRTRTAPAPDAPARLRFMIASCQRWDAGYYAAWRHAAAEPHDLALFLGDYIYEYSTRKGEVRRFDSGHVNTLREYRERYALYKSDSALQAAHAAFPWMVVWDDHEVANNYAGLEDGNKDPWKFAKQRAAAYQAYWENMPFPKAWRPQGPDMRIYTRLDWGRLARLHFVDDRQYRSRQACPDFDGKSSATDARECPALIDPSRTLLGAEQERWLDDGWDAARPWNLLAQQTLMARFAWRDPKLGGRYSTDDWDGYPQARNRLLGTVARKKVPGVVVLGGDAHCHTVADLKADFDQPAGPVVASEFCGTSISSRGREQERTEEAHKLNPHVKYARSDQRGYIRFAVEPGRLSAELTALDDVTNPDSAQKTVARFVVDAKRPGPQTA